MNTIDKDKYGQITHDPARKLLRMDWFPSTAEMSSDDFKRSLTVLADAALAHAAESILVDVTDFRSKAAMEIDAWRVQNIVPKYNKVLKRFAWLTGAQPPQLPAGGDTYQNEGETYQSRWFRDEAAAVSWATPNT
jgi:hypothetical protein